jgi:sugar phosphate isomerase/epimerase
MEQNVSRRGFIGAAIGTGAAAAVGTPAFAHGRGHGHHGGRGGSVPRDRRGIQLYTMRRQVDDLGVTPADLFRALGRMGYTEVEKFTTWGLTARDMRRQLDRAGLRAISGHDGPGFPGTNPDSDEYREALEYSAELGQKFTGLAWFSGDEAPYNSEDTWHSLAEHLNTAGEIARREFGLQFFYHNHNFEFTNQFNDRPAYDILLEETDRRWVKFQLDLFWITEGGGNGVEYLSAHPDWYVSYHVKDHVWGDRPDADDFEDAGPGMLDFPDLFDAGDGRGLDKHYFIEHDWPLLSHPDDDQAEFKTALAGIRYLQNVRW